jgi:hypothetical protein
MHDSALVGRNAWEVHSPEGLAELGLASRIAAAARHVHTLRTPLDLETRPFHLEDMRVTRLTIALVSWISLVSVVSASLTPRKESPMGDKGVVQARASKLLARAPEQTAGGGTKSEFVLTDRTEVLLNGKPCKYAEVPAHASIEHMEVAADKKTVLKIHFHTRK